MKSSESVIKKLKQLLGIKTDLELANILEVKPNTVSSWKSRETLQYEKIMNLCKEHKIDLNELFFSNTHKVFNTDLQKRKVKMISVDHHFEYFLNPERTWATSPSFVFPTEEEVDTAFQISAENMYPTVKVSSYVLTKKIELEDIKPWGIYVVVIEGKGVLCYRFKRYTENGDLSFISDNETYDNLVVKPQDVREIFCVRGAFLGNLKNLS
ncbi:MAG: LexA family transcriptional regulator [Flavobacterium sp.]